MQCRSSYAAAQLNRSIMKAFEPFDYFVIAIGVIGTLNLFGVLIKLPQPIIVILGVISSMIRCFSILLLALNIFVRHLDPQQQRLHRFYVFANLMPTIYILTHLTETPWECFLF
jgi:hypothetical protein